MMKRLNILLATVLVCFCYVNLLDARGTMTDSSAVRPDSSQSRFNEAFIFGNIHGIGVEFNYMIISPVVANVSVGVKSPIQIFLDPPFDANRFNLTANIKGYPIDWFYVSAGVHFGLYSLTEMVWLVLPKASMGIDYHNFSLELGATFNTPSAIYTSSRVSQDETLGMGEERTDPSGPIFPYFKFAYFPKWNK